MSEYRIHQDINLFEIADEYAKRLQEHVDELALDMAAETLAKYGYVKVVRCRDCNSASFDEFGGGWCHENCREIKAWNFCSWGERREP